MTEQSLLTVVDTLLLLGEKHQKVFFPYLMKLFLLSEDVKSCLFISSLVVPDPLRNSFELQTDAPLHSILFLRMDS